MILAYKQLAKQLLRNRIFVALLLLLTMFTSLTFFFGIFSIDGNIKILNSLDILTENQQQYRIALNSNTILIYNFYISLTCLTAFVFVMFFYRFYRSGKRQIGCLKSLGFKDIHLRLCFVVFVAAVSAAGAVLGMIGGYFLADVLINANMETYQVTGLVKKVSQVHLAAGLLPSTFIFGLTAFLCYSFVGGKEPGVLIAGNSNHARFSLLLQMANGISRMIPVEDKFPYRIALRKPVAVLLLIAAVMSFSVCMILGRSLNISSQSVFESQTAGHNYEFDTKYDEYQFNTVPENGISYLDSRSSLVVGERKITQTLIGLYNLNHLYELRTSGGDSLSLPGTGTAIINPGLYEMYGVDIGDTINVEIKGTTYCFTVADIAVNAKSAGVYINAIELAKILGLPDGAYNGALSMEKLMGGIAMSKAGRIDELNRNAVSNKVSGVINQVIGCIVGAIMIFLALYVNFQDNTRDMLILHMMGYRTKNIRKLMMDVYMPIVWAAFLLTLVPSIILAASIQKSLSVSTNDYMPFETNISVVLSAFIILNVIFLLLQALFELGIRRIIAKEEITEMIYAE